MKIIAQKTNTKALILLDLLVGIVLTGGIAIFLPVYVFSIDASLLTNFYVWAFVLGCILFFGLIAYFFSLRPLLLFSRLPQVQAETDGTYLYIHSTKEAKIPLAECLLEKLDGPVLRRDLFALGLQPLDRERMAIRDDAAARQDFSHPLFDLAKEFAGAETIVIAAPYWDLMFPAVLKTYLETISVAGITFVYTPEGRPEGLCKARRCYYVTTAGGFLGENNFGFTYLKALAQGLFGIEAVECFSAEDLDIDPSQANALLEKAKAEIRL